MGKKRKSGYIQYRKDYCEKCLIKESQMGVRDEDGFLIKKDPKNFLTVHHIDHDPSNNEISNLQTLCLPCHTETHRKENIFKFIKEKTPWASLADQK